MPRKKITISEKVEYLSILNEKGQVDKKLEPDIDEDVLTKIANITGGKYYRATDRSSLEKIYEEIGELEKTKIEVKEFTRYTELFVNFLAIALGILLLEILLANTRFRKIP